jgi:hypothetical protein
MIAAVGMRLLNRSSHLQVVSESSRYDIVQMEDLNVFLQ